MISTMNYLEIDDQGYILEEYSKLINYFDPAIKFQLFLFGRQVNEKGISRSDLIFHCSRIYSMIYVRNMPQCLRNRQQKETMVS